MSAREGLDAPPGAVCVGERAGREPVRNIDTHQSLSAGAGRTFAAARDSALAHKAFPPAHWPKIRTNNVQERANREIKRRYRVVQTFPSEASMLRLGCAAVMELEGSWATQRVFSEEPAALGFAGPRPRPAPDADRRAALERRAGQIVREVCDRRGVEMV